MKALRGLVTLLVTGLLVAVVLAFPSTGHAVLAHSDPAAGSELEEAPARVTLVFTEEPEPALSNFQVMDVNGRDFAAGRPQFESDRLTVIVPLKPMEQGAYSVNWRVVSKVDGHLTAGVVPFGVGVAPASPSGADRSNAGGQAPALEISAVLGRWLFLTGVILLIGCSAGGLLLFDRTPLMVCWLMMAACVIAVGGVGLMLEAQLAAADVGLETLARTFTGKALLARNIGLAVATVAIVFGLLGRGGRWMFATAGAGALAAVLVHTAAGHAGATRALTAVNVSAQTLHFVAAGVWIGGLAAVIAGSRKAGMERGLWVRKFSTVAGISLVVVAVTGLFRAWISMGSISHLLSTPYGRVVSLKIGMFLLLAVLGAVNRYRNVSKAAEDLRGLRRVASVELALGALIITATSILSSLSPPAQAPRRPVPEAGIVATASDFATTMNIRLEVTPGDPGLNEFRATITDFDTREPVSAGKVSLRFVFLGGGHVGESVLDLKRERPGVYTARGGNLLLDGPWRITTVVQMGQGSTEVSLPVATRCSADRAAGGGEPAIYNVPLAGSRSAQGYLDPGRPGSNEIHITFFDSNGQELEVEDGLVTLATVRGSEPVRLEARRLSKGHFISDLDLGPGFWRFDFIGRAGDPIRACFEQRISRLEEAE